MPAPSASPARSSTSTWATRGRPLACRNASRDELKAYGNALRERGKGAIEIAMTRQIGVMDDPGVELLDFMLAESGRPVTFIAMFDRDDIPEAVRATLRKGAPMIRRRAAADLAAAAHARDQHAQPVLLRRVPVVEARVRGQVEGGPGAPSTDPAFRNQFREELKRPASFGNWARITCTT